MSRQLEIEILQNVIRIDLRLTRVAVANGKFCLNECVHGDALFLSRREINRTAYRIKAPN